MQLVTHRAPADVWSAVGLERAAQLVAFSAVLAAPLVWALFADPRRAALGGLAPVLACALVLGWGPRLMSTPLRVPATSSPPVLLLVLDTVRADSISSVAGSVGDTPAIAAIAADGVVFTRAHAPAPWTTASFGSLFTSLYPDDHGAGRALPSGARWGRMSRSVPALYIGIPLFARGSATIQGQVLVHIDQPRCYRETLAVDDVGAVCLDVLRDLFNFVAFDQNVGFQHQRIAGTVPDINIGDQYLYW